MQTRASKSSRWLNRKHSIILIFAVVAVVAFVAVVCIMNYVHAANNNKEAAALQQQVEAVKGENETLEHYLDAENLDELYEKYAREEGGYGKPGERVFFDSSSGN